MEKTFKIWMRNTRTTYPYLQKDDRQTLYTGIFEIDGCQVWLASYIDVIFILFQYY